MTRTRRSAQSDGAAGLRDAPPTLGAAALIGAGLLCVAVFAAAAPGLLKPAAGPARAAARADDAPIIAMER